MKIVITIGGSIIMENFNPKIFKEYARILTSLQDDNKIFIVIGGGQPARDYIRLARELGANEAQCDNIGIEVTRLNAKMLITALGEKAYPMVPHNFNEALEYSATGKIIVMGGTEPAHSTDAVGAILAELVDADILINLTSVDGFYDKDPHKYPDARFYKEITATKMLNLFKDKDWKAGTYEFLDLTAIHIIRRSNIKSIITNGKDPMNLIRALKGEVGTKIIPE
ncbi:UMP kinase [Methanothermobacter tenebrarum]|uniref:Uridylate kinase n=1 Tax=Methanothermobacter tenebrarum TaxID=680118 RepID=A0A328PI84_9EURY|nr:UMP kinase [Methanothermobacter tenebrarum]MBC7100146.1 UMP kinase [Methanobacteriales archaeon]MBC7117563.1 UMP kinase [Methanobacteriaceae archaeon]NPV64935.1 UMP kinase [Methanobacteriaceae archaeon]RAO79376.1 UMP kinase [Methanothermobacter tenebrarum]